MVGTSYKKWMRGENRFLSFEWFSSRFGVDEHIDNLSHQEFVISNEWLVRIDGINDLHHAHTERQAPIAPLYF